MRHLIVSFGGGGLAYQAMKHTILAASRRLPKPPNTHSSTLRHKLDLGGEMTFLPFCSRRRWACDLSRPVLGETDWRERASLTEILCQSKSAISVKDESKKIPIVMDREGTFHCRLALLASLSLLGRGLGIDVNTQRAVFDR